MIICFSIIELQEYLDGLLITVKCFLASLNLKKFQIYLLLSRGFIVIENFLLNKFNFLQCEALKGKVFDSSVFSATLFKSLF